MARATTIDPQRARDAIKKHLSRLQNACNGVQYQAQRYEIEAVDTLAEMMRNEDLPAALRRQVALDLTTLARGQPRPWLHDGLDIDPNAPGAASLGATVSQEIEAAKLTSGLHKELDSLISRNIHPRDWSPEIRSVAGDMLAYYEGEEGILSGNVTGPS